MEKNELGLINISDLLVQIFDILQAIYYFLLPILIVANIFFAITIVFVERKNPQRVVSWILVLLLLPFLGFFLYLVFGQNYRKEKLFSLKNESDQKLTDLMASQIKEIKENERYSDQSMVRRHPQDGGAAAPE